MEIALMIGAALLGGLIIYLAILGQEMCAAERRTRGWAEEPSRPAPESYRGKIVSVRFIKRDGNLRYFKSFILVRVERKKSGKILLKGVVSSEGWISRSFCQDQLLAMKVVDVATEMELEKAYLTYQDS